MQLDSKRHADKAENSLHSGDGAMVGKGARQKILTWAVLLVGGPWRLAGPVAQDQYRVVIELGRLCRKYHKRHLVK